MSDLDLKEQVHVRTALRHLHRKIGTWATVASALRIAPKTLEGVLYERAVTASLALRVARLMDLSMDALLAGQALPGACPHCGYMKDGMEFVQRLGAESSPLSSPPNGHI